MTRETKIGLLVGLAFILVVGILLSEHITGATERPAAPLADAGHGVGRGVSAPGAATDEEISKVPEPQQPVPTPADLTPKPVVTHVTVVTPQVPPANPTVIVSDAGVPMPINVPAPQPAGVAPAPTPPGGQTTVIVRAPTDPFANDPVVKAARQMGEVVIPVGPAGKTAKPAPADKTVSDKTPADKAAGEKAAVPANATAAREYKAQAGDTLSRLASQLPGGNVKANRDAVVALNPILQKDPNRVLAGHSYLLPTGFAKPAAPTEVAAAPAKPTPAPASANPSADAAARVYVVKAGDTLSKIASTEMGSKSELPTLRKLNADVLKGSDTIKVDMKLKLPAAKMMASIR